MLYLRRTAEQSITLFDRRTRCLIEVHRVDPILSEIDITVSGIDKPLLTLKRGNRIRFLQGEGEVLFKNILVYDRYPPAASLGIKAPKSMRIYRSELLTGLGPDQIAALC